ncbi:hypothetical protein SAMN02745116_01627 [Pilibacter termitis]|uniref:YesK-like protein n=1 Tax=Pilibacter termitis TaxID=263852 RepID=A0A1T4P319_9ENTE|nr:hypothetical protein [Pilibacter termitis]SJZ85903.1 hypothetical protein SAMN02745116_01627 [Pilibacter termitis]
MVPFIIYWFAVLVGFAWIVFSLGAFLYYLAKKENGNLWFFIPLNLVCLAILAIIVFLYRANEGFGITQYSSIYFSFLAALLIISVLDLLFGKTKQ